jgi:hypothetical protein
MFAPDNTSTPISFNADVSDEIALAEGDEAADRIISGATLIDHLKIGRALLTGSRIAAREADCDRGKPYTTAFHRWLEQHPKLNAVNEQNRAAALWCLNLANYPRVEKYLATLDVEERQTITLRTVRRRLDVPSPRRAPPEAAPRLKPGVAPRPQHARTIDHNHVREAADSAEIATLKKEVWRLRDKLNQLAIYLVEKPPPKAEDRPFVEHRYWPPPEVLERRPKDVPPRQIVNPGADLTGDPAFALRREEFEQHLVRRKEALELKYAAREKELKDTFEPRIKARVKKGGRCPDGQGEDVLQPAHGSST